MDRDAIITRLRENETALRARGVAHAAVFGSRARGDNRSDSDIDIFVDLDPAVRMTVFDYVGVKNYISGLFEIPVDVVNRAALKPDLGPTIIADAVYAF